MSTHALATLSNPLATPAQLQLHSTIPPSLHRSLLLHGTILTHSACILLRLPLPPTVRAILTFQRFYTSGRAGGSFGTHAVPDVSAASVFLATKISVASARSPRAILDVFAYLSSIPPAVLGASSSAPQPTSTATKPTDPSSYTLTAGEFASRQVALLRAESLLLHHVSAPPLTSRLTLPHTLALTYLSALALLPAQPTRTSTVLARRVLAHLNAALLSPQLLYLTHQPHALAVAAVYLAAREVGVKIRGGTVGDGGKEEGGESGEWWELLDVGREELGFLVVGLGSVEGFVEGERRSWEERRLPRTVEELREEVMRMERESVDE